MPSIWVVVADSGSARIFKADSATGPLQEFVDFTHPEALVKEGRLVSDRAGRTRDSHGRSHSFQSEESPRAHEAKAFARLLGDEICLARAKGEFEHLLLVAAPEFLGRLRTALDDETRKRIDTELPNNFVGMTVEEIRSRLPERLYSAVKAH